VEYVEAIYYRQVTHSDFKNIYLIDRRPKGGGQRYLEAAGISNEKIASFCAYANQTVPSATEPARMIYTIDAFAVGKAVHGNIEFSPRPGRNYRISRQNLEYRHPAWLPKNGFPEPPKEADGSYSPNFGGLIDNLIIYIVRTTSHKYFAGFVDSASLPDDWPHGVGLEPMFEGERRDVIFFKDHSVEFTNNSKTPFDFGEAGDALADVDFSDTVDVSVDEGSSSKTPSVDEIIDDIGDMLEDSSVTHATGYRSQSDIEKSNNRTPVLDEKPGLNHRYKTDPRLSKTVIDIAGYACDLIGKTSGDHQTFDSEQGHRYVEAHHLIPMKAQKDFPGMNLDRIENIVSLCPNCHRAVHLGTKAEKIAHLKPLYDERMPKLKAIYPELDLSFDDLINKYYK
jgi:5-methylcytosine-specific restriction endonuclease McrA